MHNGGNDDNDLEDFVAHQLSLREHLSAQLPLTVTEPVERLIGQHLIDLVDEAGYLPADLEALSQRLGAPLELIESVLGKLQTFDPPGIFARSLAECLALQLKDQNRYDPLIAAVARQSRSTRQSQYRRAEKGGRRRHGRAGRDDPRDQAPQPQAGPEIRLRAIAARRAGRHRPRRVRRQLDRRTQQRHAAARARQSHLLHAHRQDGDEREGQRLSVRMPADRELAR